MYRTLFSYLKKLNPLTFLLVLSLFSTPFQLKAQSCCYQPCEEEVNCCQGSDSFQNRALIVGGAAIVGGVIGAVIGSSNHHHSSSGSRGPSGSSGEPGPVGPVGPMGPVGPAGAGFITDPGQTLTFNLSVTLMGDENLFSGTLIPFVTGPDGNTVEGTPIVLTEVVLISNQEDFAPIVVTNPSFGQYQAGVQVLDTAFSRPPAILSGNVVASRDDSTTNLVNVNFNVPLDGLQVQAASLFSYDPLNIP